MLFVAVSAGPQSLSPSPHLVSHEKNQLTGPGADGGPLQVPGIPVSRGLHLAARTPWTENSSATIRSIIPAVACLLCIAVAIAACAKGVKSPQLRRSKQPNDSEAVLVNDSRVSSSDTAGSIDGFNVTPNRPSSLFHSQTRSSLVENVPSVFTQGSERRMLELTKSESNKEAFIDCDSAYTSMDDPSTAKTTMFGSMDETSIPNSASSRTLPYDMAAAGSEPTHDVPSEIMTSVSTVVTKPARGVPICSTSSSTASVTSKQSMVTGNVATVFGGVDVVRAMSTENDELTAIFRRNQRRRLSSGAQGSSCDSENSQIGRHQSQSDIHRTVAGLLQVSELSTAHGGSGASRRGTVNMTEEDVCLPDVPNPLYEQQDPFHRKSDAFQQGDHGVFTFPTGPSASPTGHDRSNSRERNQSYDSVQIRGHSPQHLAEGQRRRSQLQSSPGSSCPTDTEIECERSPDSSLNSQMMSALCTHQDAASHSDSCSYPAEDHRAQTKSPQAQPEPAQTSTPTESTARLYHRRRTSLPSLREVRSGMSTDDLASGTVCMTPCDFLPCDSTCATKNSLVNLMLGSTMSSGSDRSSSPTVFSMGAGKTASPDSSGARSPAPFSSRCEVVSRTDYSAGSDGSPAAENQRNRRRPGQRPRQFNVVDDCQSSDSPSASSVSSRSVRDNYLEKVTIGAFPKPPKRSTSIEKKQIVSSRTGGDSVMGDCLVRTQASSIVSYSDVSSPSSPLNRTTLNKYVAAARTCGVVEASDSSLPRLRPATDSVPLPRYENTIVHQAGDSHFRFDDFDDMTINPMYQSGASSLPGESVLSKGHGYSFHDDMVVNPMYSSSDTVPAATYPASQGCRDSSQALGLNSNPLYGPKPANPSCRDGRSFTEMSFKDDMVVNPMYSASASLQASELGDLPMDAMYSSSAFPGKCQSTPSSFSGPAGARTPVSRQSRPVYEDCAP